MKQAVSYIIQIKINSNIDRPYQYTENKYEHVIMVYVDKWVYSIIGITSLNFAHLLNQSESYYTLPHLLNQSESYYTSTLAQPIRELLYTLHTCSTNQRTNTLPHLINQSESYYTSTLVQPTRELIHFHTCSANQRAITLLHTCFSELLHFLALLKVFLPHQWATTLFFPFMCGKKNCLASWSSLSSLSRDNYNYPIVLLWSKELMYLSALPYSYKKM